MINHPYKVIRIQHENVLNSDYSIILAIRKIICFALFAR